MPFTKAVRTQVMLRQILGGLSKSGKSLTSLQMARGIVGEKGRIAAIDTENTLSLYANVTPFDVEKVTRYSPETFEKLIREAVAAKYNALILDSATTEWEGIGGILDIANANPDTFHKGWKIATPMHRKLVQTIITSPIHLLFTLRQEDEYVTEPNAEGKMTPRKVGTKLVQGKRFEYEFHLVATMDLEHTMRVQHSLVDFLPNGTVIEKPDGFKLGAQLKEWLEAGEGEWVPPVFAKGFIVNDKEVISAGIERETYVRVLNMGASLDRATKRGTAKSMMVKPSLAAYTEEEGQAYVAALEAAIKAAPPAPEPKAKA